MIIMRKPSELTFQWEHPQNNGWVSRGLPVMIIPNILRSVSPEQNISGWRSWGTNYRKPMDTLGISTFFG